MQKCDKDCYPICDFCIYFKNGLELRGWNIEDGYCKYHKKETNIIQVCEDFKCYTTGNIFQKINGWFIINIKIPIKRKIYNYKDKFKND